MKSKWAKVNACVKVWLEGKFVPREYKDGNFISALYGASALLVELNMNNMVHSSLLYRNQPVQPHGSAQYPDIPGTNGSPSCLTHEPPTANEHGLRPSGEEGKS